MDARTQGKMLEKPWAKFLRANAYQLCGGEDLIHLLAYPAAIGVGVSGSVLPFHLPLSSFFGLPPCLGRLALGNPQAILIQSENQKKGEQFCLRCCCVPIRWLSVLSRAYFSAFSNQIFGLKHHEELKRNSVAQTHLKYNSSFSYRVNEFLADSLAALTCSVHRKCKATAVPL